MSLRWIGFGSNLGFPELFAANKSTSRGWIKVCKTFIRRFDSDPRLQTFRLCPLFANNWGIRCWSHACGDQQVAAGASGFRPDHAISFHSAL